MWCVASVSNCRCVDVSCDCVPLLLANRVPGRDSPPQLVFSSDLQRTLLFNRTNKPVQSVFYSIGGRILKNERLAATALRKLRNELPKLGAIVNEPDLVLGGVMEEIFSNSAFADTNSHCVNTVFGLVLVGGRAAEVDLTVAEHDSQSSRARWFAVDDGRLHPYIQEKLSLLLPLLALAEKACQAGGAAGAGACTTHAYHRYQDGRERVYEERSCVWQAERGRCAADATTHHEPCGRADGPRLETLLVDPSEIGLLRTQRSATMTENEGLLVALLSLGGMLVMSTAAAIWRMRSPAL